MEVAKHSWEVHAEPGENGASETEQDPMVLALYVLSLSFVCGKTLAKE